MLVYYSSLKVEYLPHRETWQRQAPGRTTHAQNKKVQCCIVGPFCCTAFDANVSGYLDKNAFWASPLAAAAKRWRRSNKSWTVLPAVSVLLSCTLARMPAKDGERYHNTLVTYVLILRADFRHFDALVGAQAPFPSRTPAMFPSRPGRWQAGHLQPRPRTRWRWDPHASDGRRQRSYYLERSGGQQRALQVQSPPPLASLGGGRQPP